MRADRLVAALLVLQAKGRVTARELADELEVSEKTARRDLEALGMAGFPVYAQAGRGGGWQLLGGARTDLTGLTATEVRTLFLVAGTSSSITPGARSALRKLVRALPETFRAEAEAAADAVVLDSTAWGAHEPVAPPFLDELQRAVITRRQVLLGYRDRTQSTTLRTVHPLGLVSKGAVWYLIANTDHGMRTFRVNRITEATVTDEPAVRPDGFDLAESWRTVVAAVSELRIQVRTTIRMPAARVHGLRAQLGTDMSVTEIDGPGADGLEELIIGGPSALIIAQSLVAWGGVVEVVEPDEVREHLVRLAREILSRYG